MCVFKNTIEKHNSHIKIYNYVGTLNSYKLFKIKSYQSHYNVKYNIHVKK